MSELSAATNMGAMSAKRYMEINTAKVTRATQDLASGSRVSNPSFDPSAAAIGSRLTADITTKQAASRNASQAISMIQQATGALASDQQVLTRMKEITAQSNSDTIGAAERAKLQEEFNTLIDQIDKNSASARFGGVELFGGGAAATPTATGVLAQGQTGLVAAAGAGVAGDGFVAAIAAGTQGFINGAATEATVVANGNLYDYTLKVGDQTFKTTDAAANGTVLLLRSTSDNANVIGLTLGADVATATGGVNASSLQGILQEAVGLDTGVQASFRSLSTTAAGMPLSTLSAGSGTAAGTWALSYAVDGSSTGTFKLTNGVDTYTQDITYSGATAITSTVNFNNGASLALASFVGNAAVPQETYVVTAGGSISQQFQIGEKSSDILGVTFRSATASALGLTGLTVGTAAAATTASDVIDTAMEQIGSFIAELGGKSSQLNFLSDNLKVSIQNQSSQLGTFVDTNIAESMNMMQKHKALNNISSSVFSQALQQPMELARMVAQTS